MDFGEATEQGPAASSCWLVSGALAVLVSLDADHR